MSSEYARGIRFWLAAGIATAVASAVLCAADRVAYTPYADAQPILEELRDALPPALTTGPGTSETRWAAWTKSHDRDIRSRLGAGDEDTIVNWMLFGTSFTRRPRVFLDTSA